MIEPASQVPGEVPSPSDPPAPASGRSFAHASEAEMARILDFYGVAWHYEPTTFPILWNLEGTVVESFSPDFYLPEFDLYLEMTTLKQSLVRKKNRKLRRLRELYPDIRIKLFYARDFRAMMLKYGRLGLAASLTGTPGQLVGGELIGGEVAAEPPIDQPAVGEPSTPAAPSGSAAARRHRAARSAVQVEAPRRRAGRAAAGAARDGEAR